jgi:hypothetical protein
VLELFPDRVETGTRASAAELRGEVAKRPAKGHVGVTLGEEGDELIAKGRLVRLVLLLRTSSIRFVAPAWERSACPSLLECAPFSRESKMGTRVVATLVAPLALLASAADFEPPPTFEASKILPPALVRGKHHTVSESVSAEGYYQVFHIESTYGDMEAEGRTVLRVRLGEVDALARLDEVSRTKVFLKAAGGAALNIGKGFVAAVKDPEATAKGIGGGIKRFGVNLGRQGKRAVQSATGDKKEDGSEDQSRASKAGHAAGGAALSLLGVNSAARRWARKLNVDPYTSNPVMHDALVSIGKLDAAGSIAMKIVVPVPMIVSTPATVGNLVWGKDPEEVRKINERRLAELGVSKDDAGRFFGNRDFTLTLETRFIAALHSVKAKGSIDYVAAAAAADDERDALFFVESAELLAGLHKTRPVTAVLEDSRALIAKTGGTAVALLPFDTLRWTERLARSAAELASRSRSELRARSLEARVSGTVTPAARAGLAAAGWKVKVGATEGLLFKPAD